MRNRRTVARRRRVLLKAKNFAILADLLEVGIPHLNDHAKSNSKLLLSKS